MIRPKLVRTHSLLPLVALYTRGNTSSRDVGFQVDFVHIRFNEKGVAFIVVVQGTKIGKEYCRYWCLVDGGSGNDSGRRCYLIEERRKGHYCSICNLCVLEKEMERSLK